MIAETEIKQNCRRSAETKQPTVDSFVLFQFYFTICDGLYWSPAFIMWPSLPIGGRVKIHPV